MSSKNNQQAPGARQQAPPQSQTPVSAPAQQPQRARTGAGAGGNGSGAGGFSSQDLNKIVLEYLGKKGYHKTEQMLRAESSRTLTPSHNSNNNNVSSSNSDNNRNNNSSTSNGTGNNKNDKDSTSAEKSAKSVGSTTTNKLPVRSEQSGEKSLPQPVSNVSNQKRDFEGNVIKTFGPNDYIRAYYKLKVWIEQSLDIYKNELERMLFPIFIYIFLKLIQIDQPLYARKFFDNFMQDFQLKHHEELNKFFSINSVDHLKENEHVSTWLNNKYKVSITRTSLNLLLYFLIEMSDDYGSLIISTINLHLQPDLISSTESGKLINDGIITSTESENLSNFNEQPVKLGKLPMDPDFKKEVEYELKKQDQLETDASKKSLVEEFREMNSETAPKEDGKKKEEEKSTETGATQATSSTVAGSTAGSNVSSASQDPSSTTPLAGTSTTGGPATAAASTTANSSTSAEPSASSNATTKAGEKDIPDAIPLPIKSALDVKMEIKKVRESRDSISVDNLQIPSPSVCMYTFHNTNGDMTSISYNEDCTVMATGFQDSIIKIWSLDGRPLTSLIDDDTAEDKYQDEINGRSCRTLVGHSGPVYGLSFSPCGRYLLSCSEDKSVRLWSMETFTCLVSYKGHNHPVWDVKFSPLGHYFITGSHDQTARLWSCDHIYPLRIFAGHANDVECVTFHPNGCYVFTGSSDKTVRMWEILSGNCCRLFITSQTAITCIEVTNDGRWVAIGSEDGTVSIWDIGSGKRLKVLRGHGRKPIYSLQFNKEDSILVSSGGDNSCRVWDLKKMTSEPNAPVEEELKKYYGDVESSLQTDIRLYGKKKIVQPTADLVSTFYTKHTPIYKLKCTRNNLIFGSGPYLP